MDGQMKVTVGICAYNTEKYIKQCLLSVLGQSYENLEIIVIDDGSTDSTGAFLDTVTDTRVRVIHKQNEGLSAGREQVVQLMTGDALYWLDSDDYLMPEAISDSVSLMQ
nr:glycosyltransferase [Clostridiales bacterium]